jgi:hypothetical protein
MYIQSAYEYCSTLFFDLNSKSGLDRKYLNIKLYNPVNQKNIEISIEKQAVVLNAHGLYHLIFQTYINIKRKNTSLFKQML